MIRVRITHSHHVVKDIILEVPEEDYESTQDLLEDIQDKAEHGEYYYQFSKAEEGEYDNSYHVEIDD